RARLREVAHGLPLARLVREMGQIIRTTLFGSDPASPQVLRFEENGMVIDACELLKLDIIDPALAELWSGAQREAVKLQINDEQATRRLESERLQASVDAEEHLIVRNAVVRKAESRMIDAESDHRVDLKKLELEFTMKDSELARKQTQAKLQLDEELRAA